MFDVECGGFNEHLNLPTESLTGHMLPLRMGVKWVGWLKQEKKNVEPRTGTHTKWE